MKINFLDFCFFFHRMVLPGNTEQVIYGKKRKRKDLLFLLLFLDCSYESTANIHFPVEPFQKGHEKKMK